MAPGGQRTFSLIPTTLVDPARDPRPMTSKAAKKAYQKANRGPKVTRAEQRRLDAEERERQKKEFEREKAANKAKAAREKKAEKEAAAKLERRKLGVPEPSKFVRASQPTISKFVRAEGGKRKWQDTTEGIGEDSEGTVAEDEVLGRGPPPAKRLAIIAEDEDVEDTYEDSETRDIGGFQAEMSKERGGNIVTASVQRALQDPESEDEFGEFPTFSQPGFLEEIDSPLLPTHKTLPTPASTLRQHVNLDAESNVLDLPTRPILDEDYLFDNSQQLSDMAAAQLLSDMAEAVTKSDPIGPSTSASSFEMKKPVVLSASVKRSQQWVPTNPRAPTSRTTKVPLKPAMTHKQFKLPPVPSRLPSKPNGAPLAPHSVSRPSSKSFATPSSKKIPNLPPTSTQAFLEDNLDDFLPSPSQEMRELLDDIDADDLPSNTQIAREISPFRPQTLPILQPAKVEENYDDFVCTQDLFLSSQDMREISPAKATPNEKPVMKQVIGKPSAEQVPKPIPQPAFRKQAFDELIFDEFPSTQDLVLTPQDLKEIETPSRGPLRTINNLKKEMSILLGEPPKLKRGALPKAAKTQGNQIIKLPQVGNYPREKPSKKPSKDQAKPKPNPREKRRFFEEKETDLMQATVHESKTVAEKAIPPASLKGQRSASLQQNEAVLVQAAIQETKITAQSNPPPPQRGKSRGNRFFQEKETDLVEAAIQESKLMAQKRSSYSNSAQKQSSHNIAAPKRPLSQPPPQRAPQAKRFFQEKESDQLQAAMRESKMMAQKNSSYQSQKKPLKDDSSAVRSKRTLQRVQSTVTDYGDDELTEQDLLGLC